MPVVAPSKRILFTVVAPTKRILLPVVAPRKRNTVKMFALPVNMPKERKY